MASEHMQRCLASLNIREMPSHHRKDIASHPSGWPLWDREQVSARMWRNRKARAWLVGMSNGAAFMENSPEVPQTIKNRTTI